MAAEFLFVKSSAVIRRLERAVWWVDSSTMEYGSFFLLAIRRHLEVTAWKKQAKKKERK